MNKTTGKTIESEVHEPDLEGLGEVKKTLGKSEPAKKKVGRPKGSKSKTGTQKPGPKKESGEPKDKDETSRTASKIEYEGKHFAPTIKIVFNYIAKRLGNQWKLDKVELAQLSVATAELAGKYFPDLTKWTVELNFALVLSAIVLPRMESKRPSLPKKRNETEQD